MKLNYIVTDKDEKETIHSILINKLQISSRLIHKLIINQKIYKNDHICNTKNMVTLNDKITICLDIEEPSTIFPTKMDLNIIYEDTWLIVLDKPAGIPIHPSGKHYTDSLSNGLQFYFNSIGLRKKIRPVNRLDLDTSGLVVFAKCEYIQESFIRQMQKGIFKKEYLCIANGVFLDKSGTINLPIGRKDDSIIERCVDFKNGQPSITHYKVIQEFKNYSLVKCYLETGRTHQIRVHLSFVGHSLLRRHFVPANILT